LIARQQNDPATMSSTISMADFRKMSDEELEHLINTNPSRYDIQGAIFEHRRQILCWTTVGAIAAIIAAIAGVLMLLR
jgi:hypothetical protein